MCRFSDRFPDTVPSNFGKPYGLLVTENGYPIGWNRGDTADFRATDGIGIGQAI